LGFFFCLEFGLRELIEESKLKIQTAAKVVSFTVRKDCRVSLEGGARERERERETREERGESFFMIIKFIRIATVEPYI
jgi:hypothetical protein